MSQKKIVALQVHFSVLTPTISELADSVLEDLAHQWMVPDMILVKMCLHAHGILGVFV